MLVRVLITSLAVVVSLLGGCQMAPDYPVERLAFDETLVGTWTMVEQDHDTQEWKPVDGGIRAIVTKRELQVVDGRVNPPERMGFRPENPGKAWGYSIRVEGPALFEKFESDLKFLQFEAYVIKVGEQKLLTGQVTAEQLGKGAPFPLAIPIHHFLGIESLDGRVYVSPATERFGCGIVWLPGVEPGAPDPVIEPDDLDKKPGVTRRGWLATTSIDRALEYYDKAVKLEGFWSPDSKTVFERVTEPPVSGSPKQAKPTTDK